MTIPVAADGGLTNPQLRELRDAIVKYLEIVPEPATDEEGDTA